MATPFQRELLPAPKTFYERELGTLSRPRRGWAMANCPFHPSKSKASFSVNLENGGFHCFGCGAKGGDVLAFLRQRDGLSFKEAAQRLGAWNEAPSAETVRKLAEQARERDRQRQTEESRRAEERRLRLKSRDELHTASRIWKEACERLSELRRGAAPISEGEQESCWAVMSLAFKDLHDTEAEYCAAAGLEYNV